jgi:hypothetical protein
VAPPVTVVSVFVVPLARFERPLVVAPTVSVTVLVIPPTTAVTPLVEPSWPDVLVDGAAPMICIASRIVMSFTSALSASVLAAGAFFGTRLKSAARADAVSRVTFCGAGAGRASTTVTRSSAPTFTAGPVSAPARSSFVTSTRPRRIVIVDW